MGKVWIELAVYDHWGPQPHGIPRVAQSMFEQCVSRPNIRFFFYHWGEERLVAADDLSYFHDLARGVRKHDDSYWPRGAPLVNEIEDGDKILFSGITWYHPLYFDRIRDVKDAHAWLKINYLVNDVIPIKHPHFFVREFGEAVARYLTLSASVVDRYICISKSTARDVLELLSPTAETAVIKLGGDIQSSEIDRPVRVDRPYVLSVGTMEIRKNHIALYYAWRMLAQHFGDRCPKLIIVGRPGWLSGDAAYLLKNDPLVKDLVEIRHDVANEELVGLIQNCLFTAFPAIYEGWGLPACESYYHGKVCITANTSSLPEINPFPELMFDPYEPRQMFEIMRKLIEDPSRLRRLEKRIPDEFNRQTWKQCIDELCDIIADRSQQQEHSAMDFEEDGASA